MRRLRMWVAAVLACGGLPLAAQERDGHKCTAPEIRPEEFGKLHKLIRPNPGENAFFEIKWVLDPWEARKKAAAEGKPILLLSHAGADPLSWI